ncbi:MAG: helix-turn-helix domain-containing protein [Prevotella sp.]|jgi:AraC-like DNA-binding protein|nr:helix-turn-helix domain-containing protein [Tannerella sp.]MDR2001880.1 helix-turn-helix domain-containing protein [Prevotella sp.]
MRAFQIIEPSPLLAPYIKQYWFLKTDNELQTARRIIPNGCVCLHFHRGGAIRSLSDNKLQPSAFIAGQQNDYLNFLLPETTDIISVVFQPHGAKAFFSMPIHEFLGVMAPVDDMGDPALCELQDRLMNTLDNQACVQDIEAFLMKRLHITKEYNYRRMDAVIRAVEGGEMNVDNLCRTSCLSYRQFKRVFFEYAGINPKDFLRIIRFQKMLSLWQSQPQISFAHLAYDSGFYDQSHLINEFKVFAGYTPNEYIALCAPYSDYFSGTLTKNEALPMYYRWRRGIPGRAQFINRVFIVAY